MKFIIVLTSAFILFSPKKHLQETGPKVVVNNLEGKTGLVYIGWYNSAAAFPVRSKAVYFKVVNAAGQNEVSVSFDAIPPGRYAIAAFLDENGNGIIDKNFFGLPKEKYGFSNNITPPMRPAKYEEAVFKMSSGQETIRIKLK